MSKFSVGVRPRVLRQRLALAGAAAALAGALLGAGVAKADPVTDAAFLSVLDDIGITYVSPSKGITAGYAVCSARDGGATEMQVAAAIFKGTTLTAYQAGYFVGAAEAAFCPWFATSGSSAADAGFGPVKR